MLKLRISGDKFLKQIPSCCENDLQDNKTLPISAFYESGLWHTYGIHTHTHSYLSSVALSFLSTINQKGPVDSLITKLSSRRQSLFPPDYWPWHKTQWQRHLAPNRLTKFGSNHHHTNHSHKQGSFSARDIILTQKEDLCKK